MRRWTGLTAACLVSCGVADTIPLLEVDVRIDGGPVPVRTFCATLATVYCDAIEPCRCESVERVDCLVGVHEDCGRWISPQTRIAIDEGTIHYDPVAAGVLVQRVAEVRHTCDLYRALQWRNEDLLDFGGVMTGSLPNGQACSIGWSGAGANECAFGVCRAGTCQSVRDAGASCSDEICADMSRPILYAEDMTGVPSACIDGVCRAGPPFTPPADDAPRFCDEIARR